MKQSSQPTKGGKPLDERVDTLEFQMNNVIDTIVELKEDVTDIKENMATKDDINMIMNKLDRFLKKSEDKTLELAAQHQNYKRLDAKVEKHDYQIQRINTHLQLT